MGKFDCIWLLLPVAFGFKDWFRYYNLEKTGWWSFYDVIVPDAPCEIKSKKAFFDYTTYKDLSGTSSISSALSIIQFHEHSLLWQSVKRINIEMRYSAILGIGIVDDCSVIQLRRTKNPYHPIGKKPVTISLKQFHQEDQVLILKLLKQNTHAVFDDLSEHMERGFVPRLN